MMIKRLALLIALSVTISIPAYAQNPVIAEIFTFPACETTVDEEHAKTDHSNADHTHDDEGHTHVQNQVTSRFDKQPLNEMFSHLIEENPDILALNCYIDYSSYEIKDRTERAKTVDFFCKERNYFYYSRLNASDKINAQNLIINGTYGTGGEMQHVAQSAVNLAKTESEIQDISLTTSDDNQFRVSLPAVTVEAPVNMMVIGYQTSKTMDTVPHKNVINSFKNLPAWNGEAITMAVALDELYGTPKQSDAFVILAQDDETAKIIAVGHTEK